MTIADLRKKYLQAQDASGLKVGDKVKVIHTAKTYENGWVNGWVRPEMDELVGQVMTISEILGSLGIRFIEDENKFSFPYFVLEKVEVKP